MSRVDPSGYGWLSKAWKSVKKAVKKVFSNPVVQIVAAIVAAPWAGLYVGTSLGLSTAAGYAVSGFTAGFIASGGSLKVGLIGAATGAAFYGVGSLAQRGWNAGQTALAHGAVGGASSVASGGKFKEGFLSGGFASFTAPALGTAPGGWVGRTVAAAVIGGTASELGGGKFANGAKTFGFLRLFGEAADYYQRKVGYDIDMGPGGDAVGKGETQMPVEGANNIGTQHAEVDPTCTFCEGGPVSRFTNQIPGINAVAGMHDVLQVSMGTTVWRDVLNVPGMGVAAGVTYSGFIGQALNTAGPMLMPIRDNDRRGGYQWVMYAP